MQAVKARVDGRPAGRMRAGEGTRDTRAAADFVPDAGTDVPYPGQMPMTFADFGHVEFAQIASNKFINGFGCTRITLRELWRTGVAQSAFVRTEFVGVRRVRRLIARQSNGPS